MRRAVRRAKINRVLASLFQSVRPRPQLLRSDVTLRRLLVALMLVGYLAASVGYPSYRPAAGKESEQPFPCQHRACGCRTAEQCRRSCCCHSKATKITWALERGIDPSRVAILTPEEVAYYSQHKVAPAVAQAKQACCHQSTSAAKPKQSACCSKRPAPGFNFVLGIQAQKCRGSGVDWIQAGFIALPPDPVGLALIEPAAALSGATALPYLSPTKGQLARPG